LGIRADEMPTVPTRRRPAPPDLPAFADRAEAGVRLGGALREALGEFKFPDVERPVVFAIPRGGVAVAAGVARCLAAPLEVIVVRKIGHPEAPEFGLGAIAEGGEPVFDDAVLAEAGLTARAALRAVAGRLGGGRNRPVRTVLAVPIAAQGSLESINAEADEMVTVVTARRLRSVGEWYADFGQLTDADVLTLLAEGQP